MIRGWILAAASVGAMGCGAARGPAQVTIVSYGKVEGQKALMSCLVKQGMPADEVKLACGEPAEELRSSAHDTCWIYENVAELSTEGVTGTDLVAVCLDSRSRQAYTREGKDVTRLEISRVFGLRGEQKPMAPPPPPRQPAVTRPLPPPPPPPPPASMEGTGGEDEDL
ncbi:MAG: hypothetical protein H6704_18295 [Myxococcales bacterium]|nr:hypothetical protein [Myxococcales bacterium]